VTLSSPAGWSPALAVAGGVLRWAGHTGRVGLDVRSGGHRDASDLAPLGPAHAVHDPAGDHEGDRRWERHQGAESGT
jgi:hypothetical protein